MSVRGILERILVGLQQMQHDRFRLIVDGRAITNGASCSLFHTARQLMLR